MRPFLACLFLLLTAMREPIAVCPVDARPAVCPVAELGDVRLDGPGAVLVRDVEIGADALPLPRPLMVRIIALASAEVSWNGIVIGRNGVPGADAAHEVPGLFIASFVVPDRLVRPGRNRLAVRLSAQHLWLPVRRPVHVIEVGPYETPTLPGLSDYLPALLVLSALAAAFLYFAGGAWSDRGDRPARLLAGIAGAAMLELAIEVARTFVAYTYPWHLVRVSAIALLAAAASVLIAAYAGQRFTPASARRLTAGVMLLSLASLIFFPWYDLKALGAILAGLLALGFAAWRGIVAGRPGAKAAALAALAMIGLMIWQRTAFLDQAWYLALAAMLAALVAEQLASLRRARAERDRETKRAAALAERLARAERKGEPILALKDGSRTHRVAEGDISFIRAADDYCDVVLADDRTLLVTMSLARLLGQLPGRFVRVHKSYAVNRPHVASAAPRPGGGRVLTLSDGSEIPVGRAYAADVSAWLRPSPSGG